LKPLHRACPGVNQDGTLCRSSVILESGRCISHPHPDDAEALERKIRAVNAGAQPLRPASIPMRRTRDSTLPRRGAPGLLGLRCRAAA
jgi:hypothetical protein